MKIDKMDQWTDSNHGRVGTAEPGRNSFGSSGNTIHNQNHNTSNQLNTLTQSRNKEDLISKPGLVKGNGIHDSSA